MRNSGIINRCNAHRAKIFYKLKDLIILTGLSSRMLKYKMLKVKKKYAEIPSLLRKEGTSWKIHISIVNEFLPVRKRKESHKTQTLEWRSMVTWNMANSYETAYHLELLHQIKLTESSSTFRYVIENDGRMVKHVHFLTNCSALRIKEVVRQVLSNYMEVKEYVLNVRPLRNTYSALQYLNKAPVASGTI